MVCCACQPKDTDLGQQPISWDENRPVRQHLGCLGCVIVHHISFFCLYLLLLWLTTQRKNSLRKRIQASVCMCYLIRGKWSGLKASYSSMLPLSLRWVRLPKPPTGTELRRFSVRSLRTRTERERERQIDAEREGAGQGRWMFTIVRSTPILPNMFWLHILPRVIRGNKKTVS